MRRRSEIGGGTALFWGGIQYKARTELVAMPRPALTTLGVWETYILEAHVAQSHSAEAARDLTEVGILKFDWPP